MDVANVPQTIQFFGRPSADAPISKITGKLSFEESDTVATMLRKAGFDIYNKVLIAWELGAESDWQFLFDGKLKATLTKEHTDILIKAEEVAPSNFIFH
ncbi:hypothetical protein HDU80_001658 [Chytriomyces hyalinus]|nr:hypothetical protein HDU80_001658 [Chytriomyces hyalinus]